VPALPVEADAREGCLMARALRTCTCGESYRGDAPWCPACCGQQAHVAVPPTVRLTPQLTSPTPPRGLNVSPFGAEEWT
jgi:hypothetical protein